jgi:hypothetical protein
MYTMALDSHVNFLIQWDAEFDGLVREITAMLQDRHSCTSSFHSHDRYVRSPEEETCMGEENRSTITFVGPSGLLWA